MWGRRGGGVEGEGADSPEMVHLGPKPQKEKRERKKKRDRKHLLRAFRGEDQSWSGGQNLKAGLN